MSYFQRIKNIFFAVIMLLLALQLALSPDIGIYVVAYVLVASLLLYGIRLLWYYFTMARYMVSGKSSLYQAIIALDIGLFTGSLVYTGRTVTVIYLLGVFLFSGFVDLLRALEEKRVGAQAWRLKLFSGFVRMLLAVVLGVAGFLFRSTAVPVYGYCVLLTYTAVMRVVAALRKTAIVYIQ